MSRPLPQPISSTSPSRSRTGASSSRMPGAQQIGMEAEAEVVHEREVARGSTARSFTSTPAPARGRPPLRDRARRRRRRAPRCRCRPPARRCAARTRSPRACRTRRRPRRRRRRARTISALRISPIPVAIATVTCGLAVGAVRARQHADHRPAAPSAAPRATASITPPSPPHTTTAPDSASSRPTVSACTVSSSEASLGPITAT